MLKLPTLMLLLKYAFRREPTDIADLLKLPRSRILFLDSTKKGTLNNKQYSLLYILLSVCTTDKTVCENIFKGESGNYLSI